MPSFDLIVMGAGIAGIKAAKKASDLGASVGIVEGDELGGTCPIRGCMPKKFLVIAAEKIREAHAPGPEGLDLEVADLNWGQLIDHEQSVVNQLGDTYATKLQEDDNIQVIDGYGQLTPDRTVQVNGTTYEADSILLATGLKPAEPPIEGIESGQTSDEFLRDRTRPDSVVIVGGGYIGVEFASILHAFGTEVTVLEALDQAIPQYGADVAEHLVQQLERRGIDVRTSAEARAINTRDDGYGVTYRSEGEDGEIWADRVLSVAGRVPNIDGIGLEAAGVQTDDEGLIEVNEYFETSVDGIYAAGDVIGPPQLTPAAVREGQTAVRNALSDDRESLDFSTLPSSVFTLPPVASVGYTEPEAKEEFDAVTVGENQFKPFVAGVKKLREETFVKTLFAGSDDRLVGLHVVGPNAYEVVQGFALSMELGCTRDDVENFSGIHPTIGEEVLATT